MIDQARQPVPDPGTGGADRVGGIAPGEFGPSALSNSGEEIAIIAEDGITDIRRFTYSDQPDWATSPDLDADHDGTGTFRSTTPFASMAREFLRLQVTSTGS